VSAKVISDVGLQPGGKLPVGGVHGSQPTNSYQFQVIIIFVQGQAATGAMTANVHATSVTGVEFIPAGNFDVLLGRDILCQGSFSMTWDGHAVICL
jgi:hypothetical protein